MSVGLPPWGMPLAVAMASGVSGEFWLELLRLALALGFVCALAWLLLRFGLPRWLGSLRAPGGRGGAMRVIERHPLSAGKTLWLVEVGARRLLIGGSEGGLQLLAELAAENAAEEAAALHIREGLGVGGPR